MTNKPESTDEKNPEPDSAMMGQVFIILGFTFMVLGVTTNWIFSATGVTFLVLGIYYFQESRKQKETDEPDDKQ